MQKTVIPFYNFATNKTSQLETVFELKSNEGVNLCLEPLETGLRCSVLGVWRVWDPRKKPGMF